MKYYPLLIGILLLFSCQEAKKKVEITFLEDDKNPLKRKIEWVLLEENKSILGLSDESVEFLRVFYADRKNKALWINDSLLTDVGALSQRLLQQPLAFGLPSNRIIFNVSDSTNLIIKELLITNSLATLSQDLRNGFFDSVQKKCASFSYPAKEDLKKAIIFPSPDLSSMAEHIISWGPRDSVYQNLAKAHFKFVFDKKFDDENLKVPLYKKDSLNSLILAKKALYQKAYINDYEIDSSVFMEALRKFQTDNGITRDGLIGYTTAEALNETNLEKAQRSALVMEKLRWRKEAPKRHIEINIPEYTLRLFDNDTLKSVHRIIVGKYDTQTPEFEAELRTIVSYPTWTVPFSIKSKEFLPAVQKNSNYFVNNHMKIYDRNGVELDSRTVNWKAIKAKQFPYKVVQQPGKHNALGIIKFEFNNKYGVYIHDTPQKSLFNTIVRSYSHGCMRCEKPIELAKKILEIDQNDVTSEILDSLLIQEKHHFIRLKTKIPIRVEYRSVVADSLGKITFLKDIYYRDKKLTQLMFSTKKPSV